MMTGGYAHTPQLWLSFLTAVLLVTLSIFAWRRRSVPGAVPFAVAGLFTALWAASSFMEHASANLATKILWVKVQAVWQLPAITGVTCFILECAWPGRWLTRRTLALLSIVPLLVLLFALTNDLHHLMWIGFHNDGRVLPVKGPAIWVFLAYGYALGIANILLVARLYLRWPEYRWPMAVVLISQVAGRAVYLLEKVNVVRIGLPLDILALLLVFLAWAVVLFRLRILDPVPLARRAVIAQMRDGLLVLDAGGRIVSLNPAAQAILGAPGRTALGRPVQDLLPAARELDGGRGAARTEAVEVRLGTEPQARDYLLGTFALKDVRGLTVGSVLLLHDWTERRRAQAQILEQQRALAMLQERERLARELHDSLGQVLSYAGFQVETAAKLSRDGQGVAAAEQLDRLGAVVRGAHADLREVILNLRSTASQQQPFFTVVKQYLDAFTSSYDIQTHLSVDPRLESCAPETQLQFFRVLQEALSNARKHGGAHQVHVTFARGDGRLCMSVHDDGRGFDPDHVSEAGGPHFGFQFMRERALEMGGSLQIHSAPGAGTRVVLEIPEPDHV